MNHSAAEEATWQTLAVCPDRISAGLEAPPTLDQWANALACLARLEAEQKEAEKRHADALVEIEKQKKRSETAYRDQTNRSTHAFFKDIGMIGVGTHCAAVSSHCAGYVYNTYALPAWTVGAHCPNCGVSSDHFAMLDSQVYCANCRLEL